METSEIRLSGPGTFSAPVATRRLETVKLREFVERYIQRRQFFLDVVRDNPPPLYLIESDIVRERARYFKETFQRVLPLSACYYAVKCNAHPGVIEGALACGFGLDVSSGAELAMALKLGARDMVFSGPGKTDGELLLALDHADRVVVLLDSQGEFQRLNALAGRMGRSIRCGIRVTTSSRGLWRKFGISLETLPEFWETALLSKNIQLSGIQFHTSWNLSPEAQVAFISQLGGVLADMHQKILDRLKFIDIGGGYWPEQGEWVQFSDSEAAGKCSTPPTVSDYTVLEHYYRPATSLARFAAELASAIGQYIFPISECRIFLEPGRWICSDAVQLVFSVVDRKAPDLVITDAGTNAIGWERFETDYFPVINLSRPSLTEKACHVLGSLCTPHDVWGYAYFGTDIREGDILMIPTQGAYTYSLRQNFIKPLPEAVLL